MGVIFAALAALTWSIGVVLFKLCSERIDPIGLNIYKNIIGFTLMLPTWYLLEPEPSPDWLSLSGSNAVLFLSGFIGIGIADSFYLIALKKLGAGRVAIIDTVYIPFVILLSFLFLSEQLSILQFIGILLVVLAILLLNASPKDLKDPDKDLGEAETKKIRMAALTCVLAVFSTAAGIVACKPLLKELPLIWLITYRLGAGVIGSFVFLMFMKNKGKICLSIFKAHNQGTLFLSAFSGTYLAMIFWIAGFKYEQATVVAVINQTSTLMVVFLAALFLGEPLTSRKLGLAAVATVGVILVSVF